MTTPGAAQAAETLEFGVFVTPDASRLDEVVELGVLADVTGLDLFTVQDHPYQERFADAWTLLGLVGARTSAVRLSTNVSNLPLRPPLMLAKQLATLDLATSGRVELGLGAGAFWDAIVAAGGPRRTPGEAVEALEEAIGLMRAFWAGGSLRVEGQHYAARGLHAGPAPAHPIPIWLGALKPRMLRLVGRLADGWIPSAAYAPPEALGAMNATIDEAALAAGRRPEDIRRMYNVTATLGSGDATLRGTPAEWAEQLVEITIAHGMSTYILATDDATTLRRWAEETAPAARELLATERSRGPVRAEQPAVRLDSVPPEGGSLRVRATPDDGTRLRPESLLDEASRPTHDEPADATYRVEMQANSQHLIDIHNHLRSELEQVRDVLDQVRRGHLQVSQARSVINTMTMRQNNWTLGAYCESYCRVVTGHHTLEDRSVFPHLRRSVPALAPVIDRLEEEHVVIHDVLEAFDSALVRLVGADGNAAEGRDALDEVQRQLDLLTDTLLSHLSYEERELVGPLARVGFQ